MNFSEYGVVDEDELFHLSNTPALSEIDECKARELIRRAEEGRVDPAMKNKFAAGGNRSCKRLMNIIDEILNSDYDPDAPPADPTTDSEKQPHGAEPKPWKCNLETSRSSSHKSHEASQSGQRQSSLDSSRLSSNGQHGQNSSNCQRGQNGSNVQHGQTESNGQRGKDASDGKDVDVNCKPSNKCCPSGFNLDPIRSRQSSHPPDREAHSKANKDFEFSDDSQLEDFNLEDERADDLFANLPPDSSTEDVSPDQSRKNDKSSKKNSK